MRTQKIPNMEVTPTKGDTYVPETPPDLPRSRCLSIWCGRKNQGKATGCCSMIERMGYDRVLLCSPTAVSNAGMVKRLKIAPEDIFYPNEEGVMQRIIEVVEKERDEYELYVEQMKLWKKFMKQLNSNQSIFDIPEEHLTTFFEGGEFRKPQHKYGGRKPYLCCTFDDCLSSFLFTRDIRTLNSKVILMRHIGELHNEPGALGLDMHFLTQAWKSNIGTLPPVIRNQCTVLAIFRTKSKVELKAIQEECSGEVDVSTFYEMYERCTSEPHGFMFIDLYPKDTHPSQYRKCLDTFIIPEDKQISQPHSK